jgi:uncharacterized membrane protein
MKIPGILRTLARITIVAALFAVVTMTFRGCASLQGHMANPVYVLVAESAVPTP